MDKNNISVDANLSIQLPANASMAAYQHYIHALEKMHGWLDVDLVHNCFLMGEEVGELFKAVRRYERYYESNDEAAHHKEQDKAQCQPEPGASEAVNDVPDKSSATNAKLSAEDAVSRKEELADELVDVMNYIMAIANRVDVDLEQAFRKKNARNQKRTWNS